ncbi:hypothetical protein GYM41_002824 [Escherichia coli]|nr:hypothetical protein [Escherichia coli]EGO6542748.1 hypothetical protein [Escherichia coli]EGO6547339.1 hypothetical protein [Escherichia coli]EGO6580097.1 hypothetical protein [Escherichia coli]EGO6588554.1 hypothetical protein [Escherichia coli]
MLYGTGFEASMAVQFFKTLLNQILLLSSLQSGWSIASYSLKQTNEKSPHRGEWAEMGS